MQSRNRPDAGHVALLRRGWRPVPHRLFTAAACDDPEGRGTLQIQWLPGRAAQPSRPANGRNGPPPRDHAVSGYQLARLRPDSLSVECVSGLAREAGCGISPGRHAAGVPATLHLTAVWSRPAPETRVP